jgi:hypothetical protein
MAGRGNFWPGMARLCCYFRGTPLTTGWWDPAVCHEPCVNVNNLGCDPLSTSEPWFLAIRFPNSTLSAINIYLYSLVIFVRVLTTKVTESCSFKSWLM